jgi:hypothetical protein
MRMLKVLHKQVLSSVPGLHAKRAKALMAAVQSLLQGAFLTVTALGCGLRGPTATKHNIKRMDRLLSNPRLHAERLANYRALCQRLCQHLPRPLILVDWSDIVEQHRLLLIRAALVVDGRTIPLFEAGYPLKHYNSQRTPTAASSPSSRPFCLHTVIPSSSPTPVSAVPGSPPSSA